MYKVLSYKSAHVCIVAVLSVVVIDVIIIMLSNILVVMLIDVIVWIRHC